MVQDEHYRGGVVLNQGYVPRRGVVQDSHNTHLTVEGIDSLCRKKFEYVPSSHMMSKKSSPDLVGHVHCPSVIDRLHLFNCSEETKYNV